MNKRLEQFLKAENISQSQFADSIGVARASVSHILAGRNKPGFDFLVSMSRQYPALNLEWLITGKGKMFSGGTGATLFDDDENQAIPAPQPRVQENTQTAKAAQEKPEPKADTIDVSQQIFDTKRNVSKIIIFFDDNTYQELK